MPSARVKTATTVNPRSLASIRRPYRKSWNRAPMRHLKSPAGNLKGESATPSRRFVGALLGNWGESQFADSGILTTVLWWLSSHPGVSPWGGPVRNRAGRWEARRARRDRHRGGRPRRIDCRAALDLGGGGARFGGLRGKDTIFAILKFPLEKTPREGMQAVNRGHAASILSEFMRQFRGPD